MNQGMPPVEEDVRTKRPLTVAEFIAFSIFSTFVLFMPIVMLGLYIGGYRRWRHTPEGKARKPLYVIGIIWSIIFVLFQLLVCFAAMDMGNNFTPWADDLREIFHGMFWEVEDERDDFFRPGQ